MTEIIRNNDSIELKVGETAVTVSPGEVNLSVDSRKFAETIYPFVTQQQRVQ